jgi:hypothetical protein
VTDDATSRAADLLHHLMHTFHELGLDELPRERAMQIRGAVADAIREAVAAEADRCAGVARRVADEMKDELFGEIAARRILVAIEKPNGG